MGFRMSPFRAPDTLRRVVVCLAMLGALSWSATARAQVIEYTFDALVTSAGPSWGVVAGDPMTIVFRYSLSTPDENPDVSQGHFLATGATLTIAGKVLELGPGPVLPFAVVQILDNSNGSDVFSAQAGAFQPSFAGATAPIQVLIAVVQLVGSTSALDSDALPNESGLVLSDFPTPGLSQVVILGLPDLAADAETIFGDLTAITGRRVDDNDDDVPVEERLANLIQVVELLNLKAGISNSFDAKINSAMQALSDVNEHNDLAAAHSMQALINAVQAQRGKKLTEEQADALIVAALDIIAAILETTG